MIRERAEREPLAPRAANPAIPRDLETIVLKAIARSPEARYGNAAELADDLRRFIDDRPVLARPVGNIERLLRWRRRNRALAALSAAAMLSLLLALAAGWIGYVKTTEALTRESQRRADADEATQRAEANVQISLQAFEKIFDLLEAANPGADRRPPIFADGRPGNGRRPDGPPDGRPDGPDGNGPPPDGFDPGPDGPRGPRPPRPDQPNQPNRPHGPRPDQGPPDQEPKANVALFQSVLNFYDQFAEKNETNTTLQFEAAKAYSRVGELQLRVNKLDEAEAALRRAMRTAEKLNAEFPGNPEYTGLIARTAEQLGLLLQRNQKITEAEAYFQQALKLELALLQEAPGDEHRVVDLARTRQAFADLLQPQKRYEEARKIAEATIAELKPRLPENPRLAPWLGMQYRCLADALKGLNDNEGAARATKEFETLRKLPMPPPPPPLSGKFDQPVPRKD
jgi:tetratricopeptide (TPR) repeat protein